MSYVTRKWRRNASWGKINAVFRSKVKKTRNNLHLNESHSELINKELRFLQLINTASFVFFPQGLFDRQLLITASESPILKLFKDIKTKELFKDLK